MPPRPLITGPFFRGHAAQEAAQPLSAYTAHFEPTVRPNLVDEIITSAILPALHVIQTDV